MSLKDYKKNNNNVHMSRKKRTTTKKCDFSIGNNGGNMLNIRNEVIWGMILIILLIIAAIQGSLFWAIANSIFLYYILFSIYFKLR